MSQNVVVDPDGDVLLQLPYHPASPSPSPVRAGSPDMEQQAPVEEQAVARELRVSSKVLCIASPVFKAMLDGRFSEGAALAEAKASPESLPCRLPLPEDDADALTLLCRVLHHATDDIPARPGPDELEELAVVCDKYQCTPTLRYCGAVWLRNWLLHFEQAPPEIETICLLLVFAYVTDLAFEFCELAWKLLLYHKGPLTAPETEATVLIDHPLLHPDIGGKESRIPPAHPKPHAHEL